MDDDDPVVKEGDVPSFSIIQEKIKTIDNAIIIFRIYYFFSTRIYRFQLIKKDKMCMVEIPRGLLETLNTDGTSAEQELSKILNLKIEDEECWQDIQG
jgi:hypothetical protein